MNPGTKEALSPITPPTPRLTFIQARCLFVTELREAGIAQAKVDLIVAVNYRELPEALKHGQHPPLTEHQKAATKQAAERLYAALNPNQPTREKGGIINVFV